MAKKKIKKTESDKLNDKQRRFAEEYIVDWNKTQAAIRAGYAFKGAAQQGSRLYRDVKIRAYIDECKTRIEELAGISKLKAVKRLAACAFADMSKAFDNEGKLKPLDSIPEDVRLCIQGIENISMETGVDIQKVTFVSQRQYIQDISKMLGWNEPDKIEHSGDINIEI